MKTSEYILIIKKCCRIEDVLESKIKRLEMREQNDDICLNSACVLDGARLNGTK